jgi:hypothetical protein
MRFSPVPITAGVVYVPSYFATVSHFSADFNAFATVGVDNPPLRSGKRGKRRRWGLPVQQHECLSDRHLQCRELLGGRGISAINRDRRRS